MSIQLPAAANSSALVKPNQTILFVLSHIVTQSPVLPVLYPYSSLCHVALVASHEGGLKCQFGVIASQPPLTVTELIILF